MLEHVVWSLDERGFLDAQPSEIASRLRVAVGSVLRVIELVQRNGPPGVAARDLTECLLLQLDRIDGDEEIVALARLIVEHHLTELASSRFGAIAEAEGTTARDVAAAAELIRARLRPYASLDEPGSAHDPPAFPDVIVRETEAGFAVDLVEQRRMNVVVAPSYSEVDASALDKAARARIESQLSSARSFELRLHRRWQTMRLIAEETVARQSDFVLHGPSRLKPLTRADIAATVGVHESTVSRAIAGRYVLLAVTSRRAVLTLLRGGASPVRRARTARRRRADAALRRRPCRRARTARVRGRTTDGREVPRPARHPSAHAPLTRSALRADRRKTKRRSRRTRSRRVRRLARRMQQERSKPNPQEETMHDIDRTHSEFEGGYELEYEQGHDHEQEQFLGGLQGSLRR